MNQNINPIEGEFKAIGNRVLVSHMEFGEQVTKGGIVLTSDDGKTRGVHPRWGKVYSKGPRNKDTEYDIGDWVLVEHGRWTRGFSIEEDNGEVLEIRMVEAESILGYSHEKPDEIQLGNEYSDGQSASFDPSTFVTA